MYTLYIQLRVERDFLNLKVSYCFTVYAGKKGRLTGPNLVVNYDKDLITLGVLWYLGSGHASTVVIVPLVHTWAC